MALSGNNLKNETQADLKAEIKSRLSTHLPPPEGMEGDALTAFDNYRDKLATALSEACAKIISEKVVAHIKSNLVIKGATVKIPANSVVTEVAGQATGTMNQTEISCVVNFNDNSDRLD